MSMNNRYEKIDAPSMNTQEQTFTGEGKPKKKNNKFKGGLILLGLVVVLAGLVLAANHFIKPGSGHADKAWSSGDENVAVIHVEGEIQAEGDTYNQEWISNTIRSAQNDRDNRAILLLINSPGGTVYESDATWKLLKEYREKTKRPVYAYCERLCASGGYYIASGAQNIAANRNSLVGSIGVIGGSFVDARGLMEKLGVSIDVIHSGKNKLMGSPYAPPTDEQKAIMQSISDEAYHQFVGVVAEGRGVAPDQILPLADGRIYSAQQAKNNGLIDEVMDFESYKNKIKKDLKAPDMSFKEESFMAPKSFFKSLTEMSTQLKHLAPGADAVDTIQKLQEMSQSGPKYLYEG